MLGTVCAIHKMLMLPVFQFDMAQRVNTRMMCLRWCGYTRRIWGLLSASVQTAQLPHSGSARREECLAENWSSPILVPGIMSHIPEASQSFRFCRAWKNSSTSCFPSATVMTIFRYISLRASWFLRNPLFSTAFPKSLFSNLPINHSINHALSL